MILQGLPFVLYYVIFVHTIAVICTVRKIYEILSHTNHLKIFEFFFFMPIATLANLSAQLTN